MTVVTGHIVFPRDTIATRSPGRYAQAGQLVKEIINIPALIKVSFPVIQTCNKLDLIRELRRNPELMAGLLPVIEEVHSQEMSWRTIEVLHVLFVHITSGIDIGIKEIVCIIVGRDDRRLVLVVTEVRSIRFSRIRAVVGEYLATIGRIKADQADRTGEFTHPVTVDISSLLTLVFHDFVMQLDVKVISGCPQRSESIVRLVIAANIPIQGRVLDMAIMLDLGAKNLQSQGVLNNRNLSNRLNILSAILTAGKTQVKTHVIQ